jgi:predicted DCC family thiol-disulfide oxidoreductase YuxK
MKREPKNLLLYDQECPLCTAYSGAFVKLGILLPEERKPFAELQNDEFLQRVDATRQGNEIPLVDLSGGATVYGVDALVRLLARRWPLVFTLFKRGPLRWLMGSVYAIVSANRRIILPRNYTTLPHSCAPSFHTGKRLVFLVFSALIAVLITRQLGGNLAGAVGLPVAYAQSLAVVACGAGWAMQALLALAVLRRKAWDYLGHLAVLQLIGVLMLLPALVANAMHPLAGVGVAVLCACVSSALLVRGHVVRVRVLGMSQGWTMLWLFFLLGGCVAALLVGLPGANFYGL